MFLKSVWWARKLFNLAPNISALVLNCWQSVAGLSLSAVPIKLCKLYYRKNEALNIKTNFPLLHNLKQWLNSTRPPKICDSFPNVSPPSFNAKSFPTSLRGISNQTCYEIWNTTALSWSDCLNYPVTNSNTAMLSRQSFVS